MRISAMIFAVISSVSDCFFFGGWEDWAKYYLQQMLSEFAARFFTVFCPSVSLYFGYNIVYFIRFVCFHKFTKCVIFRIVCSVVDVVADDFIFKCNWVLCIMSQIQFRLVCLFHINQTTTTNYHVATKACVCCIVFYIDHDFSSKWNELKKMPDQSCSNKWIDRRTFTTIASVLMVGYLNK